MGHLPHTHTQDGALARQRRQERDPLTIHDDHYDLEIDLAPGQDAALAGVRPLVSLLNATDLKVVVAQYLEADWKASRKLRQG